MEARIVHPFYTVPGALEAFHALGASAEGHGVPSETIQLVQLRASQINGCEVCIGGHCTLMRRAGETDERLDAVADWANSERFSAAERSALALAEEVTRLADRPDAVPDEVWDEAARHFDEVALGALLIGIVTINVVNRLNVATRMPAGAWAP